MKKHTILILLFAASLMTLAFGSTLSRDVAENMNHLQEMIRKPFSERFVDVESQEYLFCLSHADDTNLLRDALAMDWPSGAAEIYDWIFVMSAATPGRSTNALEYSPYASIKKMRGKLEEISEPDIK